MCVRGGRSGRMAGRTPNGAGPLPCADRVPRRRDRVPTTSTDCSPKSKQSWSTRIPWQSRSSSCAWARSARRTTASSSPTRAPSATAGRSRRSASTTRRRTRPSSRSKADRAAYWLSVGAQPTEAVTAILKVSGDWQKFKGLPAPPPMLVAKPKADKRIAFEVAAKEGAGTAPSADATTPKSRKAPAKKTADPSSPESSDAAAVAVEAEEAAGGVESVTAGRRVAARTPRAPRHRWPRKSPTRLHLKRSRLLRPRPP